MTLDADTAMEFKVAVIEDSVSIVCPECDFIVCDVEEGDTLNVLLTTAEEAHVLNGNLICEVRSQNIKGPAERGVAMTCNPCGATVYDVGLWLPFNEDGSVHSHPELWSITQVDDGPIKAGGL